MPPIIWIIVSIIILLIILTLLNKPNLPNNLYNQLLVKTLGDKAKAERLIEYERQYYPKATRNSLIKHAIERLERDNR